MSMFVTYEQNVDILHAHRTCNIELTRCPYDYLACGWMDFIYLALDKRLLSCFLALCILHLHLMVMIARWFSESPTSIFEQWLPMWNCRLCFFVLLLIFFLEITTLEFNIIANINFNCIKINLQNIFVRSLSNYEWEAQQMHTSTCQIMT